MPSTIHRLAAGALMALGCIAAPGSIGQCRAAPHGPRSGYYYLRPGKRVTWVMKSGDATFRITQRVASVKAGEATIVHTGVSGIPFRGHASCRADTLCLDFQLLQLGVDRPPMQIVPDRAGTPLQYPARLAPSMRLPDARAITREDANGHKRTDTATLTNRVVEGADTVTTPAGRRLAYRITYEAVYSGGGEAPPERHTEWFVPGYGVVKVSNDLFTLELRSVK